jgi:hypoxanthine phosphoribosyltransferase
MSDQLSLLKEVEAVYKQADCLIEQKEIDARVASLAEAIANKLADSNPLVLCIMNGALPFTAALIKCWQFPLQLDYLHLSRYGGALSGGEVKFIAEPSLKLSGRVILLVDDILDHGVSLQAARDYCIQQGASDIYSVVLVKKQLLNNDQLFKADFTGFECEDRYLFGFGMDYKHYLRNAPGIYAVKK